MKTDQIPNKISSKYDSGFQAENKVTLKLHGKLVLLKAVHWTKKVASGEYRREDSIQETDHLHVAELLHHPW